MSHEVAVGPGGRGGVSSKRRHAQDRQAIDVLEGLIWGHDDTAEALAIGRSNRGHRVLATDRDGLSVPVDHVVALRCRPYRLGNEGELLRKDLLERPIPREEPVAHHHGLLAVSDHFSIERPVVVALDLLSAEFAGEKERASGNEEQKTTHLDTSWWSRLRADSHCIWAALRSRPRGYARSDI